LPLDIILRPILDITEVWFIHGNHDSDRPAYWYNLHRCGLAKRSLHGRVVEIARHRIAGLGGTFESQVWLPGSPDTGIQNYREFLERLALRPQHADIVSTKNSTLFQRSTQTTISRLQWRRRTSWYVMKRRVVIHTAFRRSMSSPKQWGEDGRAWAPP